MAIELHRLAARLGVPGEAATAVVSTLELIDVEREDFIAARHLVPGSACTLDVLHVAVAARVAADQVVTYDRRQAEVAQAAGLVVASPR